MSYNNIDVCSLSHRKMGYNIDINIVCVTYLGTFQNDGGKRDISATYSAEHYYKKLHTV
jgi:hypothetical protein